MIFDERDCKERLACMRYELDMGEECETPCYLDEDNYFPPDEQKTLSQVDQTQAKITKNGDRHFDENIRENARRNNFFI